MKILLLTNGYPPHRWAGTETYTAGIADELMARGHQVSAVCVGQWEEGLNYFNGLVRDIYHSIPIDRFNLNWKKAPDPSVYLYNNPVIASSLKNYLNENRPDLVHITSCETLSASVIGVVKAFGIPQVLTLTDFWFLCPRINLLRSDGSVCDGLTTAWQCLQCQTMHSKVYRWPRRFLSENFVAFLLTQLSLHPTFTRQRGLRGLVGDMRRRKDYLSETIKLPDARITASSFVRDLYQKNGTSSIIVRSYGHDLTWVKDFTGKTISDRLRIAFIGQISPSKGIHVLLEAFNKLDPRDQEKLKISIYGNLNHDVSYSNRLNELANAHGSIQFCGIYPHEQSSSIFADIDILAVPSVWFDFPLVIYEAFATNTPVIASNLGGMAEAVEHNVNGLLFESGNASDLKTKIVRFLDEPGLLAKLQAGVPPVKKMEQHIDELVEIYQRVMNSRQLI
jgi:glycosyltransferase involved in cell wall biosynthesis